MIWEAVHVQFLIRKLAFTIIPISSEGNTKERNILILEKNQTGQKYVQCKMSQQHFWFLFPQK